jgi:hypothetical protein
MGYLELSGREWQQIQTGIETGFPFFEFTQFVQTNFPSIAGSIPWMRGASSAIFEVLQAANSRGILDQFLTAAAQERPFRPDLRQLVLYCSTKEGWAASIDTHGLPVPDALEGLTISGNPFVDTSYLAQWIINTERQVAVVRSGNEAGTGFLVGPDLLMTNYHVVKPHLDMAAGVRVRFDYRRIPGEAEPDYEGGEWLDIDPAWEIPFSPYSQADIDMVGDPDESELDFALLKLNRRVGDETPFKEDKKRGWLDFSQPPPLPAMEAPIFIVQHPGVDPEKRPPLQMPLKLASATPGFIRANGNGTRLIYGTSTKKGSSGSPVFDDKLKPVALHHNGGKIKPDQPSLVENNRGIPLHKIYRALDESVREKLVPPA